MNTAHTVLAVDLGRTGCRARLSLDGTRVSAVGAGLAGLTATGGAALTETAILAVVKPLLAQLRVARVDAVGVGAPGVFAAPAAARDLAQRLRTALHARVTAVASDAITSHAGAFAGGPGVVLAAGTGAIVTAIGPDSAFHRVDGWGPWLGDEGSGAWLGLAGLRAAMRASDGRGAATRLADAAWSRFGSPNQLALALSNDPNPARTAATFAPVVAEAAAAGDAIAQQLIGAAATALADSISTGVRLLQGVVPAPVPVALLGGLVELGPILLDPLRAVLQRKATSLRWCAPAGTSLDGAHWLATHGDGIHEPWVVRVTRAGTSAQTDEGQQPSLRTES